MAAERCEVVPKNDTPKKFFCIDCGIELDHHDVTANLNTWGIFKLLCSDDIENHTGEQDPMKWTTRR